MPALITAAEALANNHSSKWMPVTVVEVVEPDVSLGPGSTRHAQDLVCMV